MISDLKHISILMFSFQSSSFWWRKHLLWKSGGWGEEMNHVENMSHAKEQMRYFPPCVVVVCLFFFFYFIDMLTPISVVLRLYEAHARPAETQQLSSFFSFFRGFGRCRWKFMIQNMLHCVRLPVVWMPPGWNTPPNPQLSSSLDFDAIFLFTLNSAS